MTAPEEKDIDDLINAVRASSRSPADSVALILKRKKRRERQKTPKTPPSINGKGQSPKDD